MNKFIKKSIIVILLAAIVAPTLPVASYADSSIIRDISGSDRFSTAISISKSGWSNGSENVILVNSQAVSDSLSVAPFSSKLKAPVLLTDRDTLKWETKEEIKRLKSKRIVIIGGYSSVSKLIEEQLKAEGYKIERISGNTRVETSINIAKRLKDFSKEGFHSSFVVNGIKGLADAAGVGSIAAKSSAPIIFADKNKADEIKDKVKNLGIKQTYLIGGKFSLPSEFEGISENVERISGENRQETNLKLINKFYKNYNTVYIADDGSMKPSKLIDSVLINAGIIASNNIDESVEYINPENKSDEKSIKENEGKKQKENIDTVNKEINAIDKKDLNSNEKISDEEVESINSQEKKDSEKVTDKKSDVSYESIDEISSSNKKSDTSQKNKTNSVLEEGPVMLVSDDKGLTYNQMKNLNSYENSPKSIVQVSGGKNFKNYIENIADFIVNKNNQKAKDAFSRIMSYEDVVINYNVLEKKKTLDGNYILQMIECNSNNDFNLVFNKDMVRKFISEIDLSGMTYGATGAYAYTKNGKIIIDKSGFGTTVNVDKETNTLIDRLYTGKSYFNLVPSYIKKNAPKGAVSLGNKYIQIDLKTQYMWVWKDGKAIVSTPIVSGNPNKGMSTPPGIFTIRSKMRNVVLRGPGYASPVKYWIPFNGSIGIHDASWQPIYGGNRYFYAGSHGCINTPLKAVGTLYNNVSLGTPVIVQSDAKAK